MSVTIELLDCLKASNGGASDYRIAKILGLRQQTISDYRNERISFSEERVIQACELMHIEPAPYLFRLQAERARCDKARDFWNHAAARLAA